MPGVTYPQLDAPPRPRAVRPGWVPVLGLLTMLAAIALGVLAFTSFASLAVYLVSIVVDLVALGLGIAGIGGRRPALSVTVVALSSVVLAPALLFLLLALALANSG